MMIRSPRFRPIWNAKEASWLQDRLDATEHITSLVPAGFEAYARLLHPAEGDNGELVRWTDVAERLGRQPEAFMSFSDFSSQWSGKNPAVGNLAQEDLDQLCRLLKQHTATPEDCFFCLWVGYGWHPFGSAHQLEEEGPLVRIPWREYFLFNGPVDAASDFGQTIEWPPIWPSGEPKPPPHLIWLPRSPNIWWPADHSWCVATEVDLDSTYVAGSAPLITAIVECPQLEARRVTPGDPVP